MQKIAEFVSLRLSSPSVNGLLRIAGSSGIAQVAALAAAPVLSRIYAPEAWGAFAVVSAFAVIFGTVAAFRLELAIPLPASDSDASGLLRAALYTTLLTTTVATFLVLAARDSVASILGFTESSTYLVAAPLIGGLLAGGTAYVQWALRRQLYGVVAVRNVVNAVGASVAQVALGLVTASPAGLILGLAAGYMASIASLVVGLRREAFRAVSRARASLRGLIVDYARHSLLLTPAGLLNALGTWLPPVLMAAALGMQAAGLFALAQRVLILPVALLGGAIAQVYLSELARSERSGAGRANRLFFRASRSLAIVSACTFAAVFALAPSAFVYVFGAAWSVSGEIARALCLGVAAQLVAAPLSQTLIVLRAHAFQLAWDAARLAGTVAIFVYAWAVEADVVSLAWWFSVWSALVYGASWLASARAIAAK